MSAHARRFSDLSKSPVGSDRYLADLDIWSWGLLLEAEMELRIQLIPELTHGNPLPGTVARAENLRQRIAEHIERRNAAWDARNRVAIPAKGESVFDAACKTARALGRR